MVACFIVRINLKLFFLLIAVEQKSVSLSVCGITAEVISQFH